MKAKFATWLLVGVLYVCAYAQIPATHFYIGTYTVGSGDTVAVSLTAADFTAIVSTQFSVHWNPAVARLVTAEGTALEGAVINGDADAGQMAFSWFDVSTGGVAVTDGTALLTLRFKAIGNVGDSTLLTFDGNPVAIEVRNRLPDNSFGNITPTAGKIIINSCPPFTTAATVTPELR